MEPDKEFARLMEEMKRCTEAMTNHLRDASLRIGEMLKEMGARCG